MFNSEHPGTIVLIQFQLLASLGTQAWRCLLGSLPMKMTTTTRQVGDVTVVDIIGRIELGEESAAVRDVVCDLLSEGHTQILLNLGEVHYIDSMGLGTLVSAFTSVRKRGEN
jgi:anti-anti-sigma factor